MNGPEHYAEAERLLAEAVEHRKGGRTTPHAMLVIEARTHATLALVKPPEGDLGDVLAERDRADRELRKLRAAVRDSLAALDADRIGELTPRRDALRDLVGGA